MVLYNYSMLEKSVQCCGHQSDGTEIFHKSNIFDWCQIQVKETYFFTNHLKNGCTPSWNSSTLKSEKGEMNYYIVTGLTVKAVEF